MGRALLLVGFGFRFVAGVLIVRVSAFGRLDGSSRPRLLELRLELNDFRPNPRSSSKPPEHAHLLRACVLLVNLRDVDLGSAAAVEQPEGACSAALRCDAAAQLAAEASAVPDRQLVTLRHCGEDAS